MAACAQCRSPLPDGAAFCGVCGSRVTGAASGAAPGQGGGTPGQSLPGRTLAAPGGAAPVPPVRRPASVGPGQAQPGAPVAPVDTASLKSGRASSRGTVAGVGVGAPGGLPAPLGGRRPAPLPPPAAGSAASFITGIFVILYGVFTHHWFINQISAIFCILIVVIGLINKNSGEEFGKIILQPVAAVAPGAFMVGMATSIKVALDMGHISDTIAHYLSQVLIDLPICMSAVGMALTQTLMNFVIPSGSGQALATLPVMIPVGEVIGMTRQSTILAFQIGDGVSNLINPSLGGIGAMLDMCRVPFDRWLRFIFPLFLLILLLSLIFVAMSVPLKYGPF